jgi:hypothetical protein
LQENPLGNHANDIILDSTLDICLSRGETWLLELYFAYHIAG